jgi:phage head maturation protease
MWKNRKKHLFAAIRKTEQMDDGTIKVWGYASTGAEDSDKETVTPDAMKAALPDYMKFGAVREMHDAHKAAGTAIEATVEADGKTWFGAHVVDPVAVTKVQTGVYKGFSIGGKVTERDNLNKSVIKGLKLIEVSLVDRPANPEAVITVMKAETSAEDDVAELADLLDKGEVTPAKVLELIRKSQEEEAPADPPAQTTEGAGAGAPSVGSAAATEQLAPTEGNEPEGGNPTEEPSTGSSESGTDTGATKAATTGSTGAPPQGGVPTPGTGEPGDEVKKGMSNLSTFASLLQSICYLAQDTAWEAEYEGDNSPLPDALKKWLKAGLVIFQDMATEETAELVATLKEVTAGKNKSAGTDDLRKNDTLGIGQVEELIKTAVAPLNEAITKAGKENEELRQKLDEMGKMAAPGKALLKAVSITKEQDNQSTPTAETAAPPEGTPERAHWEMRKVYGGGKLA